MKVRQVRSPQGYLFGAGADTFAVIPARVLHWISERTDLDTLRGKVLGLDPEVYNSLVAFKEASELYGASLVGSSDAPMSEVGAPSRWLTTKAASIQLGVTQRAVVLAIKEERLPAEKDNYGRWQIRRDDLTHYQQRN